MKVKPALFNGEMVRALLEGRKTQTRRLIKPQPVASPAGGFGWQGVSGGWYKNPDSAGFPCPYGQPGDLLWVRETWYCDDCRVQQGPYILPGDLAGEDDKLLYYRATDCAPAGLTYTGFSGEAMNNPWRPSIHMPRWASRLTLRLTDVRAERIQDISEADAIAEGCTDGGCGNCGNSSWPSPCGCMDPQPMHRDSFCRLWESINPQQGWHTNPWVWALTFEVIEQNVDKVIKS